MNQLESKDSTLGKPVARYGHTFGLLAILGAVFAIRFALQYGSAAIGTATSHGFPSTAPLPRRIIPGLLQSLAFDWCILYYVWAGVQHQGGSLLELSGQRWSGAVDVLKDLAITAPFWLAWEATAYGAYALLARLFGSPASAHDDTFPVRGASEIGVWMAVSISAGFCEELIFRGYLQRQFSALTGRLWLGVAMQSIVFGLIHPRGWKAVIVISLLGMLYGSLAAWRKNLRPGILAHAWSDLWEGWLKFALPLSF